jgi:two-component system, NarL family, response regulator NreC
VSVARTRILLVEDHQMVREGLRSLLSGEPDFQVVGEAADGADAVQRAAELAPDVVVMDIGLVAVSGVEAMRRLVRERPGTAVVALSMYDDAPTVDRALRAGARGYVVKGSGVAALCEAIRTVRRGETYLSPAVSEYVLRGFLRPGTDDVDPLSEREAGILRLIADGLTGRQIAERLGLRPKTVENHRARIMEKLGIHTTAGLVRYALSRNR